MDTPNMSGCSTPSYTVLSQKTFSLKESRASNYSTSSCVSNGFPSRRCIKAWLYYGRNYDNKKKLQDTRNNLIEDRLLSERALHNRTVQSCLQSSDQESDTTLSPLGHHIRKAYTRTALLRDQDKNRDLKKHSVSTEEFDTTQIAVRGRKIVLNPWTSKNKINLKIKDNQTALESQKQAKRNQVEMIKKSYSDLSISSVEKSPQKHEVNNVTQRKTTPEAERDKEKTGSRPNSGPPTVIKGDVTGKVKTTTEKISLRRGHPVEIRLPSPNEEINDTDGVTEYMHSDEVTEIFSHAEDRFALGANSEKRTYIVNKNSLFSSSKQNCFQIVFPDEVNKLESPRATNSNPYIPGWLSPVPFSTVDLSLVYYTPEHSPLTSPTPHMDHVTRRRSEFFKREQNEDF
eukprot:gene3244-1568_t